MAAKGMGKEHKMTKWARAIGKGGRQGHGARARCMGGGEYPYWNTTVRDWGNPQPSFLFPISRPILLGGDPLNPPPPSKFQG